MLMLLTRLFGAPPCARPAALPAAAPGPADDDVPRGCGWFDSSHDLLSGVVIWEGMIVVDNIPAPPP
ncbi:MAG: hypothetical protein ING89_15810 [Rubrivivax sp.]|jgi:hypothetical protein|nr:hypothetical protein [Rubrivivax sp.]